MPFQHITTTPHPIQPVYFSRAERQPLPDHLTPRISFGFGTYTLREPLSFKSRYDSDTINLTLNPVAASDQPNAVLRGYNRTITGDNANDWLNGMPLSLAFWNKPSGATSIMASVTANGKRTELFDLLDKRVINHNQSHTLYGYINLLQPEESPFREYLDGTLEHFTIELEIKGGVFDGKQVSLPWPLSYQLPEEIPDPSGFEGEENNVGSNYEELDEDNSNGGQRPWLPPDESTQPSATAGQPGQPAITTAATQTTNPLAESTRSSEAGEATTVTTSSKTEATTNKASSTTKPKASDSENTSENSPSTSKFEPTAPANNKDEPSLIKKPNPPFSPNANTELPSLINPTLPSIEVPTEAGSTSTPADNSKNTVPLTDDQTKVSTHELLNPTHNPTDSQLETSQESNTKPEARTQVRSDPHTLLVTVSIVSGGILAVGVMGGAASCAVHAGVASKLFAALKRLFFRK